MLHEQEKQERRERVLVVDDDTDIRESLSELLREEGYDVATACNGAEALAALRACGAPTVVMLDLMMPVMNGWTFLSECRNDRRLASLPVLVMSAGGDDVLVSAPIAQGYLNKPFGAHSAVQALERVCSARKRAT